MDMDIANKMISVLRQTSFNEFVRIFLSEYFSVAPEYINGKGDDGVDFCVETSVAKIAVQVTVQKDQWQEKAKSDAGKAKGSGVGYNDFMFLTTEPHESREMMRLAGELRRSYHFGRVDIWGPREISSQLGALALGELNRIFFQDTDGERLMEFHYQEAMLQAYLSVSEDVRRLDESFLVAAINLELCESNGLTQNELIDRVLKRLRLPDRRARNIRSKLRREIDAHRLSIKEGVFALPNNLKEKIRSELAVYNKSFNELKEKIGAVVLAGGGTMREEQQCQLAVHLSRLFIENQIDSMGADPKGHLKQLFLLGNSEVNIRTILENAHIKKRSMTATYKNLIETCSESCAIRHLASAVVLYGAQSVPARKRVLLLNAASWNNVKVYLDTSVAIPYLLGSLYGKDKVHDYLISDAIQCVDHFISLGAKVVLPRVYLDECAAHLFHAYLFEVFVNRYPNLLVGAENCFVAYYSYIRCNNIASISFDGFMRGVVQGKTLERTSLETFKTAAMAQIRKAFRQLGVVMGEDRESAENWKVENRLGVFLKERSIERPGILIRHDAQFLSYLQNSDADGGDPCLFLTWDRNVLEFSKILLPGLYFMSPSSALDVFPRSGMEATEKLYSLTQVVGMRMLRYEIEAANVIKYVIENSNVTNGEALAAVGDMIEAYHKKLVAELSDQSEVADKRCKLFKRLKRDGYLA